MKMIYKLFIIFFTLFLILNLAGCKNKEKKEKHIVKPVKTIVIAARTSTVERTFPGTVIASKETILSFQVPGQLQQLPILEGDRVKENQVIASIDSKKYELQVKEMEAKYIRTKADYQRASQLVGGGYISRADYDAKRAAFLTAEANLGTARRNLRDTKLFSPFDGVIAKKYVENYEFVKAKQPIAEVHDITHVDVIINVPESIIVRIRKNQLQKIVAIFEAAPERQFNVKFKEISTKADPETQTYRLRFTMPAPKDINILPGMTVTVKAWIPDYRSGGKEYYVIPASSVFVDEKNQSSVWLVDEKTMTVKRVCVTTSRMSNGDIRVLKGLKPGNRVITAGAHFLKKGEKVSLMK